MIYSISPLLKNIGTSYTSPRWYFLRLHSREHLGGGGGPQ